jgi:4-amino-4-deoxy-L-arabinose transferase-like glycosyltransferase
MNGEPPQAGGAPNVVGPRSTGLDPLTDAQAQARLDRRIGWALFALGFIALLATEQPVGFVRDESVYFHAAENHARWFQLLLSSPSRAVTDDAIVRAFDFNHEHPALLKNLFGLSYLVLHEKVGLLRPAAAFRVPAFAFAALLLPLIYALTRRQFGRLAGVFAAVSFFLVPRQFFHAHLSCFDVPVATMWTLVVYAFFRAQTEPRWWLYTGLAFGLAIATKHNAFFLPVVLAPFSLVRGFRASKGHPMARELFWWVNGVFLCAAALFATMAVTLGPQRVQVGPGVLNPQVAIVLSAAVAAGALTWQLRRQHEGTFRAMAPLVAMAALGPVVFYVHWPYLWHYPVERTAWYLNFHLTHNHYAWFYLGELLREPPFPLSYVVVKTALTVPTSLFVPMALGFGWGLWRVWKRKATLLEVLVLVNAAASIAIISQPQVPHFGGVKHWFPSMPFLAVLAGGVLARGAWGLAGWLAPVWKGVDERRVFGALATACALPALIATARIYEFGTSAYSELAGGIPGAASLGMQRQFWANNLTGVLPWLNANARPGERIYLHENHGGQVRDYQRNGLLRSDLVFVGSPAEADLVAYQYHQEFREHEFMTWQAFGTTRPVYGLYLDETPQVVIYRRPR